MKSVVQKVWLLFALVAACFAPSRLRASIDVLHLPGVGNPANGALSYQAAYTAFGEHNPNVPASLVLPGSPPNTMAVQGYGAEEWTATGALTDHFRKNTKEESDSGLINEGQRYFDPEMGRFLTADPLGLADGTNPYTYVHQNHWTNFDPEGLETKGQWKEDWDGAIRTCVANKISISREFQNGNISAKEFAVQTDREIADRDRKITEAKQHIAMLMETAEWAREHNIPVNEETLDDDANYSTSMGSTTVTTVADKLIGSGGGSWIPGRGAPSPDDLAYGRIRGMMTEADVQSATIETAKLAAMVLTDAGSEAFIEAIEAYRGAGGIEEAAELKAYGGPGGGHHIPAKSAFDGAAGYDAKTALAMPNSELVKFGVSHTAVTGAQNAGYTAFAKTGGQLTWDVMQRIETQALVKGGMNEGAAQATVTKAINALKESGVAGPTRIPWSQ